MTDAIRKVLAELDDLEIATVCELARNLDLPEPTIKAALGTLIAEREVKTIRHTKLAGEHYCRLRPSYRGGMTPEEIPF